MPFLILIARCCWRSRSRPGLWVQAVMRRYREPANRYPRTGGQTARHLLDSLGLRQRHHGGHGARRPLRPAREGRAALRRQLQRPLADRDHDRRARGRPCAARRARFRPAALANAARAVGRADREGRRRHADARAVRRRADALAVPGAARARGRRADARHGRRRALPDAADRARRELRARAAALEAARRAAPRRPAASARAC